MKRGKEKRVLQLRKSARGRRLNVSKRKKKGECFGIGVGGEGGGGGGGLFLSVFIGKKELRGSSAKERRGRYERRSLKGKEGKGGNY